MGAVPERPVRCVIWDLDGTVLDTESLIAGVAQEVLASHGAELTPVARLNSVGRRPLEAWAAVREALQVEAPAQQLLEESEAMLRARWKDVRLLPGAHRLLTHLRDHGVPMALVTSTLRSSLNIKLGDHDHLHSFFDMTCCGDEVEQGKPAPDSFLAAARHLDQAPEDCLVIEDSLAGIQAAAAAGMRAIHVPSMVDGQGSHKQEVADMKRRGITTLPSLLDFRPERFGLPPFKDAIAGTIPLDPVWKIKGTVVKGFGRGSKELGIPTANLDDASLRDGMAEAVTGIYAGWASVGDSPTVYKMCMSVGFNPVYKNTEKTCEPWILHEFSEDFYGQQIRLLVCAYIRPEADFVSLQALIDKIHEDADVTRAALDQEPYASMQADPCLQPDAAH